MVHAQPPSPLSTPTGTRHYILGTAGHIDHGKTSLVRALTGVDTDRLPEERRRGMTIELGFAPLVIGDVVFGVVDVPGHERFIRTMVAGATGIDIALIVVAADDSVMPQTIEHVDILHLLGVSRAVVAITKIDRVEEEMVELVAEEIGGLLEGTPLAGAALCPVSSVTGAGVDKLKTAILQVAAGIQAASPPKPFRMAIDRVFTVPGRGTVVTGSVLRGTVSTGDTLEVWPGGETCRVRDLQTHGAADQAIGRGQRAALNLSGIDRERIERGAQLSTPGYLQPSPMVDVRIGCLASQERSLPSARRARLSIGTEDVLVRVVLLEGRELNPGASAYAQLRSGTPLTTTYGQRFILRDETSLRTIGGGIVLRPVARRRRGDIADEREALRRLEEGDAVERLEQTLRTAGFAALTDLQLCSRSGVELEELPTVLNHLRSTKRLVLLEGTEVFVTPTAIDDLAHRLCGWLERHHRAHPELPGRSADAVLGWLARMAGRLSAQPLFQRMIKSRAIKLLGRFACLPAFAPALSAADEKLLTRMVEEIRAGGFQPPSLDGLSVAAQADPKRWERLATLAVALGDLVMVEPGMYLHREAEERLRATVAEWIARHGPVTVAEVRETLHSSRKYVVPFLEYLDRVGFTQRVEDRRVLTTPPSG